MYLKKHPLDVPLLSHSMAPYIIRPLLGNLVLSLRGFLFLLNKKTALSCKVAHFKYKFSIQEKRKSIDELILT